MSVVAKLSIGSLSDWMARMLGWSPIGKAMVIHGAEGPFAQTLDGTGGTVVSVDHGVISLETYRSVRGYSGDTTRLRLTPRHKGWTPSSMLFCRIAVVVEVVERDGRPGVVAVAIAAVDRRRSSSSPTRQ